MRNQSRFAEVEATIQKAELKVDVVVAEGRENGKVETRTGKRRSHHETADTSGGASPTQHEHSLSDVQGRSGIAAHLPPYACSSYSLEAHRNKYLTQ